MGNLDITFAALSDETRRAILARLMEGKRASPISPRPLTCRKRPCRNMFVC